MDEAFYTSASEPFPEITFDDIVKAKDAIKAIAPPPLWYDLIVVGSLTWSALAGQAVAATGGWPPMLGFKIELDKELPEGVTMQKMDGMIVGVNFLRLPEHIAALRLTPRGAMYVYDRMPKTGEVGDA